METKSGLRDIFNVSFIQGMTRNQKELKRKESRNLGLFSMKNSLSYAIIDNRA